MYLEERLDALEKENKNLRDRVAVLERYSSTRYATPKELAALMHCSVQTVHRNISNGVIQVTRKLGDPRIPLCQFLDGLDGLEAPEVPQERPADKGMAGMAKKIFG